MSADLTPLPWMSDAECVVIGIPPDLWFPDDGDNGFDALAICQGYPTRTECLELALNMPSNPLGIWGGTSGETRRKIRAQRGIQDEEEAA